MTEGTGRIVVAFVFISAVTMTAAYLTAGTGLGNVMFATLVAFIGGYLCREMETNT